LDPTDAIFVENIHTDGTANLQLGLGLFQPIGHVDFYPNGGKGNIPLNNICASFSIDKNSFN
jgi:hypothetical protein